ncbi:hypothetical protein ACFXGA_39775 [Actinosynnema sp. NPDC059335]|uniref:hypothetical protein n=1 Tax=Actinosynnema sp. NPDC059335 TaxID=3346804 RepID=UPI0036730AC2
MLGLIVVGYAVFSAILGWRLVTVVTTSADAKRRADAIRMFGYVWGSGTLGAGLVGVVAIMYRLGMLI